MRIAVALAMIVMASLAGERTHAQAPVWYWCDAARGYYPWVAYCPSGWRPVNPMPQSYPSAPMQSLAPINPQLAISEQTSAYNDGQADWRALQAWFETQTGDSRAGADYWSANRNVAGHQSCATVASRYPKDQTAFAQGCAEAARRLGAIDARRNSQPDYRAGFADEASRLPITTAEAAPAATPTQSPVPEGLVQCPSSRFDDRVQTVNGLQYCRPTAEAAEPTPNAPSSGYGVYKGGSSPIISDSPPPAPKQPVAITSPGSAPDAHGASDVILVLGVAVLAAYFLPTLIAVGRRHHNAGAILVLNLFLGWTFLGWVLALVWSATAVARPAPKYQ